MTTTTTPTPTDLRVAEKGGVGGVGVGVAAIVGGSRLCLLPPPSSSPASSRTTTTGKVPALPLRSIPRLLLTRRISIDELRGRRRRRSDGGGGGSTTTTGAAATTTTTANGAEGEGGRDETTTAAAATAPPGGSSVALAGLEDLIIETDLSHLFSSRPPRHDFGGGFFRASAPTARRRVRYPSSPRGTVRAYVDFDDGVVVRPRSSSPPPAGREGPSPSGDDVVVSLTRPRGEAGRRPLLTAANVGGYLVGDFCGAGGGLEQVLFLPRLLSPPGREQKGDGGGGAAARDAAPPGDGTAEEGGTAFSSSSYERKKRTLLALLDRSVLTDGVDALVSPSFEASGGVLSAGRDDPGRTGRRRTDGVSGTRDDDDADVVLPRIAMPATTSPPAKREGTTGAERMSEAAGAKKRKRPSPPATTTTSSLDKTESAAEAARGGAEIVVPPRWVETMEAGLRTRVEAEAKRRIDAIRATDLKRDLVLAGRVSIRESLIAPSSSSSCSLSSGGGIDGRRDRSSGGDDDDAEARPPPPEALLELVRLRYRTRPEGGSANGDSDGLSVTMHMEVDVALHGGGGNKAKEGGDLRPSDVACDDAVVLRGLHLSCSPRGWSVRGSTVRTRSGCVPVLLPGDRVAIAAVARMENVRLFRGRRPNEDDGGAAAASVAVEALWTAAAGPTSDDDGRPTGGTRRMGAVLASLRIPTEAILLTRHDPDAPPGGRWRVVDYSRDEEDARRRRNRPRDPATTPPLRGRAAAAAAASSPSSSPAAVFECRPPKVLTVLDSGDGGDGDPRRWERFAESVNAAAADGIGGRIDVRRDGGDGVGGVGVGDAAVRLLVFGSTPEERAGMTKIVLDYLPDEARVVPSTTEDDVVVDDDQRSAPGALLSSMKREVDVMTSHRKLLRPESVVVGGSEASLRDLIERQHSTDEIASRVRGGRTASSADEGENEGTAAAATGENVFR